MKLEFTAKDFEHAVTLPLDYSTRKNIRNLFAKAANAKLREWGIDKGTETVWQQNIENGYEYEQLENELMLVKKELDDLKK